MPKPRVRHIARVGMTELPRLVQAIDQYDGDETPRRRAVTRAALLFQLLTRARTNETRLATWDEFEGLDTTDPLWRVPAACMKMQCEHLVPLSRQAVALLLSLREIGKTGFVFPGDKLAQPISQNTMIYGCYRMGFRGRLYEHGPHRYKPDTGSNSSTPPSGFGVAYGRSLGTPVHRFACPDDGHHTAIRSSGLLDFNVAT